MASAEQRTGARIPKPPPVLDPSPVRFSFKYLDLSSNEKFLFEECDMDFLEGFLRELKRASAGAVSDLCEYDNDRHSHALDFNETSEPNGFPGLEEQIEPEVFWQFGIRADRPWRVHGFLIDSVFYVVWLDPNHRLG